MLINSADQSRIAAAIHKAETQTSAEIVCVLARQSSTYSFFPLFWAAFIAFLLPWPLIRFTLFAADRIYLAQILVFIVAITALSVTPLRVWLVPLRMRQAAAHRAAMEQFVLRGIARTSTRHGVLIFVSIAERWARILVDDAIAEKIPQQHWKKAIDAVLAANGSGQIAEGFIQAVEICGAELAANFPPGPQNSNELPDRIYLL